MIGQALSGIALFAAMVLGVGAIGLLAAGGFVFGVPLLVKLGAPPTVAWIAGMLLASLVPPLCFKLWNWLDS